MASADAMTDALLTECSTVNGRNANEPPALLPHPTGHAMQTISGTFADRQTAQRAVDELLARGFARASVHLQGGTATDRPAEATATGKGMMAIVSGFFSNLFGESGGRKYAGHCAEALHPGSSVVAVDTSDDSQVQAAESIMGQLGRISVDDRAGQ